MVADDNGPRTYGNWRKPRSAGMLGLGTLGTGMMFLGLIVVVFTMMTAGPLEGAILFAVLALVIGGLLVKDKHDRNFLTRLLTGFGWRFARSQRTHLYRSGPLGRVPWGRFQLPGLLAASQLSEHTDSYGRPFALVFVPATRHYTVVISTNPDGAALVDREQVDSWVASWGRWLASLGDEPGVVAVSVTIETAPDTGTRLRREVTTRIDPDAPGLAQSMLKQAADSYPAGSSVVTAYIAVTVDGAAKSRGRETNSSKSRSAEDMGRELASRLPGLTQRLSSTGAGAARPASAQELCEVVRVAYDPAAARLIDAAHAEGEVPHLRWSDVGPTAHEAAWDSYRHDAALSVTWEMSTAPRGQVQSGILTRLLAPHPDIARKRVTLLYRPEDSARAARIVEADARDAEFNLTSRQKPSARDALATRAARNTAAEEASGAGLVNFGLLVTATVNSADQLPDARAAVDTLAATARLLLRVVHGSQDSAFAAALPLGLVLPRHLTIPADVRNQQ